MNLNLYSMLNQCTASKMLLFYSHVVIYLTQFAGLGPRTQMEMPEEEAGRFVTANTLNSFKNSWC